jgi:hypothetical protein
MMRAAPSALTPRGRDLDRLHAQTAVMLRLALINRPGIVITSVPYQMAPETAGSAAPGESQ